MAHAQKPDFVFRRNGWVHLHRRGRQFSRLLADEVCASAVVMLDTSCSEVVWRVLATHSIRQFPLHFPSRASRCAITFQLDSNTSFATAVRQCINIRRYTVLPKQHQHVSFVDGNVCFWCHENRIWKYYLCESDTLNINANYSGVEYDSVQKICAQIYWCGRMQTIYKIWNRFRQYYLYANR